MPTFTSGNDTYTVTTPGDYDLYMLGGDDRLNVYGGTTVTAHLGDGNDYAVLKAALTTIFGDAGADRFDIYAASATVDGGADDDMVNVRGGTGLTATGGLGNDRFNFIVDTSSISIDGGDGNDAFVGYYHSITGNIMGGAGNDSFVQFIGGVNLYGGLGNDTYQIGVTSHAAIFENPNEGNDTVQVARGYSYTLLDNFENLVVASLAGSTLSAATLTGNELANYITAGNNDDTINGLGGNDHLFGKGGNDTIDGGNGNDLVDGGAGNDTLIGGAGNDTLVGRAGDDTMSGGTGNDVYYVDSLSDVVTEASGEGTDLVRVSVSDFILPDNVENGIQSINSTPGLPARLDGNTLDNALTGGSANDWLLGWDGNDTLRGGAGNDILAGHSGNDILNGGTGDDQMVGGAGNDTYYVDSVNDTVDERAIDGGAGNDTVITSLSSYSLEDPTNGVFENLTFNGSGGATLTGNDLANIIYGGDGDDVIYAGLGADTIYGGDGNDEIHPRGSGTFNNPYIGVDVIYAGNGNDVVTNQPGGGLTVDLGAGDDVLQSQQGPATVHPGEGADLIDASGYGFLTITYSSVDESPAPPDGSSDITYDRISGGGMSGGGAAGRIDLSAIDANTTVDGDQMFTLVSAPTGAPGEYWYVLSYMHSVLYADVDGGGADFEIDFPSLYSDFMIVP